MLAGGGNLMKRVVWLTCNVLFASCGPNDLGPQSGQPMEHISRGTVDDGDPSVGVMIAENGTNFTGCSGTLISPTVFLVAAHCVTLAPRDATYRVYFGTDLSQAGASDWVAVKEVFSDPYFNRTHLESGNDCGVLILQNPVLDKTPIPYNHVPLDASFRGQAARVIGYGVSDAAAQTGFGIKRQLNTSISDSTDRLLMVGTSDQTICHGDSGGPLLVSMGGVETIVGVSSFIPIDGCTNAVETRVDVCSVWIDSFIPDANAPTISVAAPENGATVPSGFNVEFDASDDRAVASVDVYANGRLAATARTAPWDVSLPAGMVPPGVAHIKGVASD